LSSMGRSSAAGKRVRYLGASGIAALWMLLIYLVACYACLLAVGPMRLHTLLGGRLYNALVPLGGFQLLLMSALILLVWATPVALFAIPMWFGTRTIAPRATRGRRWLVAVACGIALTVALHGLSLDGWPWLVLPYVVADDTEFAPTYSAPGFWRVRRGMTSQEVLAHVGAPLERYAIAGHPDEEGWRWSRSPHSADYRVRVVLFRSGRVLERFSEYYLD
jgi:hypothetical protein